MECYLGLFIKMYSNVCIWIIKDMDLGMVVKQEIWWELSQVDIILLLLSVDFVIENVFDEEICILLFNYVVYVGKGCYVMFVIV